MPLMPAPTRACDRETRLATVSTEDLLALATRPLFAPLASAMGSLGTTDLDALNALVARASGGPCATALGCPVRFVPPDADPIGYEVRVHQRGEVLTRPDNWHDFFNALVWSRFPQTKAALNVVHVRDIRAGDSLSGRSARRDAATQFDESGIVVLSADAELVELLVARRWVQLFWDRRDDVVNGMRFLVFGHGLYDALLSPFYGLCGRGALIEVDRSLIEAPIEAQVALADQVLAQRFLGSDEYPRAKCFVPVPVLGIPGVTAESEAKGYYEDERQFRPARVL